MRVEEGRGVERLKVFPLSVKEGLEMSRRCVCVCVSALMHELVLTNACSQLKVRPVFAVDSTPSRMMLNRSTQPPPPHPQCCVSVPVIVHVKGLMSLRLVLR